jgi:hypothetical protein
MLDRQFGINLPSVEDDEDDTPLFRSSGEAFRKDVVRSQPPAPPAPKAPSGSDDPYAYLDGGGFSMPATRPAAARSPAVSGDPYAYLDGGMTNIAPIKKDKNLLDRASEVIDPAISSLFGDNKPSPQQINKIGLEKYREEERQKAAAVADLRNMIGTDKERSEIRKTAESVVSGWLGGIASALEFADSDTARYIGGNLSKTAAALATEDPSFVQKIASGIGSIGSFVGPAMVVTRLAPLLGAGTVMARSIGLGTSVALESAAVAQETYEKAMSETGNEDLANQRAWAAAGLNLPLTYVTNKLGLFSDKGGVVKRVRNAALLEGGQEGTQQGMTNVLGFKPAGEGVTEGTVIGAVAGGGFKVTTEAANKYFANATPEERKDIIDTILEDGRQTRQQVFDSMMENESTSSILREAGITSADDPAFVKFAGAIGKIDRDLAELSADPEIGPKLIANGIIDPEDPRVKSVADRVFNAKPEVKGINEILEITRSGVELTNDQKEAFSTQSSATNARELVDEITSNPELEAALKNMPGTAGYTGNRYTQIMDLWKKATLPQKKGAIAVDAKGVADTATTNVRAGVQGAKQQREQMDKEAAEAFRLAEARRQRAQRDQLETGVQPLDTQAGGRPGGVGAKQEFAYFNPVIKDGQMVSGDRVEVVSGDQILDRVTLGGVQTTPERGIFLRFLDRPGQPEFPVPVSVAQQFVKFFDRPESPRAAQDFTDTATAPKPGVMTDPEATRGGPRLATDRITTDQSQQFVPGDRQPSAAPQQPGQTFDGDVAQERLPGPDRGRATPNVPAPLRGAPSASQTPSEAPGATRAKQASKGKGKKAAQETPQTTGEPAPAQEDGQSPVDLRRIRSEDIDSINDLNRAVQSVLDREGNNETFRAARVPLGDLVGKLPGIGLIEQVAKIFGKRVVYFRVEEGANFFNGAVLANDTTIFINVAASRPHIRIFGHELVHSLRNSNPKVYQKLVDALQPLLDERGMADFEALQRSEGVKNADKILEEAVGDIVGDRFGEAEFWQMMADNNPSTFKDVARAVIGFIDRMLSKITGKTLGSDTLVKDLRAARSEIARVLSSLDQGGSATAPTETSFSRNADIAKAPVGEKLKAERFERENDILPYTSEGQIEVPTGVMFSIKREGKYGDHPVLGIPLNKNGTVSLYFPTTNEEARRAVSKKALRAQDGATRIYLTNESSARKVAETPGTIEQQVGGANLLVQVDPDLVQLDAEYADGRKDFFIPIAEGNAFFNKMKMTKLFTLNKSRSEAISPDVTIANIGEGVTTAIEKWTKSNAAERRELVSVNTT